MVTCTWKGCEQPATRHLLDKNDEPWADLCVDHAHELETYITSGDVKRIMFGWISAQGGAEAATARMQPAIEAGARLIHALGAMKK